MCLRFVGTEIVASLNRQTIDAEHYVARYVLGRLSDFERDAFEEFCLLNPDVAEQVATDRAMRDGLRSLDARPARPRIAKWVRYSIAAGLVAAFAIGFSRYGMHDSSGSPGRLFADSTSLPKALASPTGEGFRLVGIRNRQTPTLILGRETGAVRVLVTPAAAATAASWSVTLQQEDGDGWRAIGSLSEVSANEDGDLSLLIDVRDVADTRLRITLQGSGATERFEFRVTRVAN